MVILIFKQSLVPTMCKLYFAWGCLFILKVERKYTPIITLLISRETSKLQTSDGNLLLFLWFVYNNLF